MRIPFPIEVLLNGGATDYRLIQADNPVEACEQALQDAKEAGLQPASAIMLSRDYIELLEERVSNLEACIGEMLDSCMGFETERGFHVVYHNDLLELAKRYEAN